MWTDPMRRLHDLYLASERDHPDNYFSRVSARLKDSQAYEAYARIEETLTRLDENAWIALRDKCVPYVKKRSRTRGWCQLFDHLNEARGYILLAEMGCSDIRFLQERRSAPELVGELGDSIVLVEVKSINPSDTDADYVSQNSTRLRDGEPLEWREAVSTVNEPFKQKVQKTVEDAADQLLSYRPEADADRIALLVLALDSDLQIGSSHPSEVEKYMDSVRHDRVAVRWMYK